MPVLATPTAVQTGGCTDAPSLPGATTQPNPLPVSCRNQHILVPRTPKDAVTGKAILSRTYAVEVPGQQKARIEYVMRDRNGDPVDLRACLCLDESSVSLSESAECPCQYQLVFRLAEYLSGGGCEFTATVVDAENGKVAVDFLPEDTTRPGVYFGEFALIECDPDLTDNPTGDSTVVFSNKLYVIVGRNLWNHRMGCVAPHGPPSIAEVRLHLRDTTSDESYLLDNVAFSDEEIAMAIYMPVQYWNEIPPPIGVFNTTNFPYRLHWLMAICGYLFLTVAEQQRRNNFAYSAGGVQINDQNREPNYEQAAERRLTDWKDFVRRKKAEINLSNAYGGIGSPYGNIFRH